MPDLDIVLRLILDLSFGQRSHLFPVLRIWSRIRVLLGLLDPDSIVRGTGTDPAPDPSVLKAKVVRKTLIPTVLRLLFVFLSLKNDVSVVSKCYKLKNLEKNNF
jgi:hypothetical protein